MKLELLRTVREARVTLREFNYHRSFIDEYVILAEPLTSSLALTDEEKQNFLKNSCLSDPKTWSRKMGAAPSKQPQLVLLPSMLWRSPCLSHQSLFIPTIRNRSYCMLTHVAKASQPNCIKSDPTERNIPCCSYPELYRTLKRIMQPQNSSVLLLCGL